MASKVSKGTFKEYAVTKKQPLKKFLESKKVKFEKGRAFYQLNKGEIIQDYKKVVVRRKNDGTFITGSKVLLVTLTYASHK